jgi:hypothetical protein
MLKKYWSPKKAGIFFSSSAGSDLQSAPNFLKNQIFVGANPSVRPFFY